MNDDKARRADYFEKLGRALPTIHGLQRELAEAKALACKMKCTCARLLDGSRLSDGKCEEHFVVVERKHYESVLATIKEVLDAIGDHKAALELSKCRAKSWDVKLWEMLK